MADDTAPNSTPTNGQAADSQFDQKAEDFRLDLYVNDLTFYGLGRMIQRLEWHLQQASLLNVNLAAKEDFADLEFDKKIIREATEVLQTRINRCRKRQAGSARRTHEVMLAMIQQLPGEYEDADRLYRRLRRIWHEHLEAEPLEDLFADVENPDRLRFSNEEPLSHREACLRFEARHVRPMVVQYTDAICKWLNHKARAFFLLGKTLESAQCRTDVVALLTDVSDDLQWTAPANQADEGNDEAENDEADIDVAGEELAEKLLAYKDRAVGELRPESQWLTQIKNACKRLPETFNGFEWSDATKAVRTRKAKQTDLESFLQSIHAAVLQRHAEITLQAPTHSDSRPDSLTSPAQKNEWVPGFPGISFNAERRTLSRVGCGRLRLSESLARIMKSLFDVQGGFRTIEELYPAWMGTSSGILDSATDKNAIEAAISRLRRKLEAIRLTISTGGNYRIEKLESSS